MILLDVAIKSKKWSAEKNIEKVVKQIGAKIIPLTDLKKILKKDFKLEVAVSLVCDLQMKKINFEFRGQNKATNVLSFATLDEKIINEVGLKKAVNPCKYLFLGDIVISYETLKREAAAQNKIFLDHLTHMILHSLLHLIGYDHQDENAAKIMESLEVKILQKFAIKNPYN